MTKFKITKERLGDFITTTAHEGVIKFRDGKAIKQPLFSSFYLVAKDNQLEVLTIDTIKKKIQANNIVSDIDVIEEGEIIVSDYKAILTVLKGKGFDNKEMLIVFDEGSVLKIENENDEGYEIRQRENKDLEKVNEKKRYLNAWKNGHKVNENGILIASAKDPKTNEIVEVPFKMKIVVKKDDLLKVVDDTINITKDNTTNIVFHDGILRAFKGKANDKTKGRHNLPYEDIGSEVFDFDENFYNIQTIVPHLFDKITLNIRRVESDGTLAVWIKSVDEKLKMEINIAITSTKK